MVIPTRGGSRTVFVAGAGAGALALATAALVVCGDARADGQEASSSLAGRWRAVSETQTLELRPRIRLSASASPYSGTNLGGSVGYGSMTTTHVATEPVPVTTRRTVELEVGADGGFTLTDSRTGEPDSRCPVVQVEERRGRASRGKGALVLEDAVAVSRRIADCRAPATTDLPAERRTLGRGGSALLFGRGAGALRLEPAP